MFDGIRNWFEVHAAMRAARRLRTSQATVNTLLVADTLKHVQNLINADQLDHATAAMDEAMARYAEEAAELPETVSALIALQRLDDAEALAVRGMRRNPDSRDFARLYCLIADHRDDAAERVRRWRAFRRRYPAWDLAFRMEAHALVAAAQDDAAEAVLAEGVRVLPDDIFVAMDYASRADARKDWPESIRRWTVVRDRFEAAVGEPAVGAAMIAAALVEQGLLDEAEEALKAAQLRFPQESRLIEDRAALAELRGDVAGALRQWENLRLGFSHLPRGYSQAARLLRERGDVPALDAMLAEGVRRVPGALGLHYDYAGLAEDRGDWPEAARRWMLVRQRFETEPLPYGHEALALRRLGLLDEAEQLLIGATARFPAAADLAQQRAEVAAARGDPTLAGAAPQAIDAAEPGA